MIIYKFYNVKHRKFIIYINYFENFYFMKKENQENFTKSKEILLIFCSELSAI